MENVILKLSTNVPTIDKLLSRYTSLMNYRMHQYSSAKFNVDAIYDGLLIVWSDLPHFEKSWLPFDDLYKKKAAVLDEKDNFILKMVPNEDHYPKEGFFCYFESTTIPLEKLAPIFDIFFKDIHSDIRTMINDNRVVVHFPKFLHAKAYCDLLAVYLETKFENGP